MKPWLWAAIGMCLASVGGVAACSSDSGDGGSKIAAYLVDQKLI